MKVKTYDSGCDVCLCGVGTENDGARIILSGVDAVSCMEPGLRIYRLAIVYSSHPNGTYATLLMRLSSLSSSCSSRLVYYSQFLHGHLMLQCPYHSGILLDCSMIFLEGTMLAKTATRRTSRSFTRTPYFLAPCHHPLADPVTMNDRLGIPAIITSLRHAPILSCSRCTHGCVYITYAWTID
jgi:hypothetical protein